MLKGDDVTDRFFRILLVRIFSYTASIVFLRSRQFLSVLMLEAVYASASNQYIVVEFLLLSA
jgi:hypothetical protein